MYIFIHIIHIIYFVIYIFLINLILYLFIPKGRNISVIYILLSVNADYYIIRLSMTYLFPNFFVIKGEKVN
jgi:hypothetical protein